MPDFATTRSAHIDAPPATVHALVNDFRQWPRWSPWEGIDPQLQRTYSGAATGAGSRYAWAGNAKAGAGTMEILRSEPSRVEIALEFIKPFKAANITTFAFAPAAGGTDVTWTMTGQRGVVMGLMGKLYFDRAIGKDFERGLGSLRSAAESESPTGSG
ncbi:SRPBCC family protein [Nocardioides piscis]|uniref:SRPBCC family protein n=1 Tax=Nocardioides piscis TaxID=2714938 RepID=A0A6G7YJX6_9ACTN|nr:SRPBCC family protein [Nocardioides piscis]QIK77053.1 SRPBCC family protein [Nocardioides piscis]